MSDIATTAPAAADELLTERELSKLHWRCRRGLLENDRVALLSASFIVTFLRFADVNPV